MNWEPRREMEGSRPQKIVAIVFITVNGHGGRDHQKEDETPPEGARWRHAIGSSVLLPGSNGKRVLIARTPCVW